MKYLITLKSGLSVIQEVALPFADVLNVYGAGNRLLKEDGSVYDIISNVELFIQREKAPTLYIELSEHITEELVAEISQLNAPLSWHAKKYRYGTNDVELSNGLMCRIMEMTNDLRHIHAMVITKEQSEDASFAMKLNQKRMERFSSMSEQGFIDTVKANYLTLFATIYGHMLKFKVTDMQPYLEAIKEMVPTAISVDREPFGVTCVTTEGILKVVLKVNENNQLAVEFLKDKITL